MNSGHMYQGYSDYSRDMSAPPLMKPAQTHEDCRGEEFVNLCGVILEGFYSSADICIRRVLDAFYSRLPYKMQR